MNWYINIWPIYQEVPQKALLKITWLIRLSVIQCKETNNVLDIYVSHAGDFLWRSRAAQFLYPWLFSSSLRRESESVVPDILLRGNFQRRSDKPERQRGSPDYEILREPVESFAKYPRNKGNGSFNCWVLRTTHRLPHVQCTYCILLYIYLFIGTGHYGFPCVPGDGPVRFAENARRPRQAKAVEGRLVRGEALQRWRGVLQGISLQDPGKLGYLNIRSIELWLSHAEALKVWAIIIAFNYRS